MKRRSVMVGGAFGLAIGAGLARTITGRGETGAQAANSSVDVRAHGASGDGTTDDTLAFRRALDALNRAGGGTLVIPAGIYVLTPDAAAPNYLSAAAGQFGPLVYALELRSNTRFVGDRAILKVRDGVSRDDRPQNFALFYSEAALTNLAFTGITFDLNGQRNPISPRRADTRLPLEQRYGRQHHAAIMIEGSGKADNVLIENCTFRNCAGVNCIVTGRVAPVSGMGRGWMIRSCAFLNNGLDTYDHSAIYLWCDDATVRGCRFQNDRAYGLTERDVTGLAAAIETHGARTLIADNLIVGAHRGLFVSQNLSWGYHSGPAGFDIRDVAVQNNEMRDIKYCAVDLSFQTVPGTTPPRGIRIVDNRITMTAADTNVDATNFPTAISMIGNEAGVGPIGDVLVARNVVTRARSANGRSAHFMSAALLAPGSGSIRLESNDVRGFARGLYAYTADGASCEELILQHNRWADPEGGRVPDVGSIGRTAVFLLAQGGMIGRLACDDDVVDDRSTLGWDTGLAIVRQGNTPNTRIGRVEFGRAMRFDPRFRSGQATVGFRSIQIDAVSGRTGLI